MTEKKRLFLIDGNSLLYRSYYAIQRLSTSEGFPTNAIYGFLTTLKKLREKEKPDYLGIVFDTQGPTIRHEAFKEYKAHRKPMPEDLMSQLPVLKRLINALNLVFFEYENYEADDVIASLARLASLRGIHTVIVSTDKDLLQIVDEKTTLYNPAKEIYLDEKSVEDSFGVSPSQVADVLALWGDPSDNIPGVPGIGEKTSKTLLKEFGSLENLICNLEKVKNPRLRESIRQNLDRLKISQQLAKVKRDLPLSLDLEKLSVSEPNYRELIPLLHELEFSSLLQDYSRRTDDTKKKYKAVLNEDELQALLNEAKRKGFLALDTETTSPFPVRAQLVGLSLSWEENEAFYIPLRHDYPGAPPQIPVEKAISLLKKILSDSSVRKIGQNIKYDSIVLEKEGLKLEGIDLDTMVLSYLLEPNWGKHSLDRIALHYLQTKTISYEELVGKRQKEVTVNKIPLEKVTPYACQDADLALQLSSLLWKKVKEKNLDKLYREIELPLINVLADMEKWGVKIDPEVLKALSLELECELKYLEEKIFHISGIEFNINSPQQLGHILFEKMNLPSSKKTRRSKRYSTDFNVLQDLTPSFPIARYLIEYRQLSKLKSTYADSLPLLIHPDTGRIHTSYNQTVTATGRLSSSDPNLQNIPARGELGRKFREAFIPEQNCFFLRADYSQIELRVLAHLSEDPVLIETFLSDRDIHQETATRVFGAFSSLSPEEMRRKAKIINFSIIYGASAFSLARELETTPSEAQKFIQVYFSQHPKVEDFLNMKVKEASEKGYAETIFGRKRSIPELKHKNKASQLAGRRIALNTPIQGTAADLMKKAMVDIWKEMKRRKLNSKMILQVHDELVFEVPDGEREEMESLVRQKMEKVFPLKVPLKVHLSWGINWAEAK